MPYFPGYNIHSKGKGDEETLYVIHNRPVLKKDAQEGLLAFDAPRLLSDWELGWLITAARLAGDEERLKTARAERKRRSRGVDPLEYGQLPDLKTD